MAGRWKFDIVGHIAENDYSLESKILVPFGFRSLKRQVNVALFDNSADKVEIYETQLKVPVRASVKRKDLKLPHGSKFGELWLYRNSILEVVAGDTTCYMEEVPIRIKHYFLLKDRKLSKIKREIEAFENIVKLPSARRERIPEDVRMFVWQRDKGCCTKCSSRERLEFDHIIPVVEGGSSTARNIQLLCETCNREKGKTI